MVAHRSLYVNRILNIFATLRFENMFVWIIISSLGGRIENGGSHMDRLKCIVYNLLILHNG